MTTLVWCSDGWVYDTKAGFRRRYIPLANKNLQMIQQPVKRSSFSYVQYFEEVEIIQVSLQPNSWIEKGTNYEEMYTQV